MFRKRNVVVACLIVVLSFFAVAAVVDFSIPDSVSAQKPECPGNSCEAPGHNKPPEEEAEKEQEESEESEETEETDTGSEDTTGDQGGSSQEPEQGQTGGGNPHERKTVCHKPGTSAQQTKSVVEPAYQAHKNHGDSDGACKPLGVPPTVPTPAPGPVPTLPPPTCQDCDGDDDEDDGDGTASSTFTTVEESVIVERVVETEVVYTTICTPPTPEELRKMDFTILGLSDVYEYFETGDPLDPIHQLAKFEIVFNGDDEECPLHSKQLAVVELGNDLVEIMTAVLDEESDLYKPNLEPLPNLSLIFSTNFEQ